MAMAGSRSWRQRGGSAGPRQESVLRISGLALGQLAHSALLDQPSLHGCFGLVVPLVRPGRTGDIPKMQCEVSVAANELPREAFDTSAWINPWRPTPDVA